MLTKNTRLYVHKKTQDYMFIKKKNPDKKNTRFTTSTAFQEILKRKLQNHVLLINRRN